MKPIEYWVCAVTSGEPECWDGPHQTINAAHASRLKTFPGPKFEVYRVQCEPAPITKGTVLNRPTPRPKASIVPKTKPKAKAKPKPRPKVPTVPKARAQPKPVRRAR